MNLTKSLKPTTNTLERLPGAGELVTYEPPASIEKYHTKRSENDLDLVAAVRTALAEHGMTQEELSVYDTNRIVIAAMTKTTEVQRHLLNKFFSMLLDASTGPTTELKFNLLPSGTIETWFKVVRESIIPALVQNKLMRDYGLRF